MQRNTYIASFLNTVRGHTLMAMLALLFAASQTLCCFHTHDPLEEPSKTATQGIECDICLVSSMPVDVDDDTAVSTTYFNTAAASITAPISYRADFSASPDRARAPPKA